MTDTISGTLTSYMVQNTILVLVLSVVGYLWWRFDFYLPRPLRALVRDPRKLLKLCGWLVIGVITLNSLGGVIGGKIQINDSAPHYARMSTQPFLFWRQFTWQMGLGLLLGGSFLRFACAPRGSP